MATQTQHFNLTKPDWEDRASISVLNANTDIIDAQMYDNEQSAANAIGNMAAEYDDTATYAVGDFCIYSEVLYKCVTAVTVAEAFDSTKWTPTTAAENFGSGGGGGSSTLEGLTDVDLTSPTDGQALVYDGANGKWINGGVVGSGGGGSAKYSEAVLWENSSGSSFSPENPVTITLSDSISNYEMLAFIFSNNGDRNYRHTSIIPISCIEKNGNFFNSTVLGGHEYNAPSCAWISNTSIKLYGFSSNYPMVCYKVIGIKWETMQTALIFSEEEREVGVWTDGKPLYQKTVSFGALPNNTTKNVAHGIQNADFINPINVFAFYPNAQHNTSIPAFSLYNVANGIVVNVSNTDIEITARTDVSAYTNCYVTLLYTKTTDTAGSGTWTTMGEYAHHYSTSEKVIGTWIDGKPWYEKTFSTGWTISASTGSAQTRSLTLPVDNVDILTSYQLTPLSLRSSNSAVQGNVARVNNFGVTIKGDITVNASQVNLLQVEVGSNIAWVGISDMIVTIQYTKTTD